MIGPSGLPFWKMSPPIPPFPPAPPLTVRELPVGSGVFSASFWFPPAVPFPPGKPLPLGLPPFAPLVPAVPVNVLVDILLTSPRFGGKDDDRNRNIRFTKCNASKTFLL